MAHLVIRLLGPFQASLDGEPITGFHSDKVRALLTYLCVEAERPHRRERLAGLLWPDLTERSARTNLRHALANLRQVIRDRAPSGDQQVAPPFLLITRQTIRFNTESNAWVDAQAFASALGATQRPVPQLEGAIEWYRSEFLEGFSLPDSAIFEEWQILQRERFHRLALDALHRLVQGYTVQGEYDRALTYAWRQVELDPLREKAHRQLMRLLAYNGQASEALARYETCRRLLVDELGAEPSDETVDLCEQIRDGTLAIPEPFTIRLPAFLLDEQDVAAEGPVFVARERELSRLHGFLEQVLAGHGQVAFVAGEAGSGKTALLQEFSQRAQGVHPDLLVAGGKGNAYTGAGDPYLPFRQALSLLTGDIEAPWSAGAIDREQAFRLWHLVPTAAQALVEIGPGLVGTFVPGDSLLGQARAFVHGSGDANTGWLAALEELVAHQAASPGGPGPQQSDLFEQYTRVLHRLARSGALLLVLDDLQWADAGSIDLLFHLGRGLAGSRILVIGAYRPEEVALPRQGERHQLAPVVHELLRVFGDVRVDLDQAGGREFLGAFLDTEPNDLDPAFRETLHRQTAGHPLFTIELLRGMQERGDLVRDRSGRWVEGPALDWETLPARVEAVISERIGRLAGPLQEMLRVASVEGEEFTAEVVARVQATDERPVLRLLSAELDRQHRLISARRIQRLDGQILSRYRFRHILFQNYLYAGLDAVERAHVHEEVGRALENLYEGHPDESAEIAAQLARHFREAGLAEKAVLYLLQAGRRAVRLSAHEQAIAHFTKALESLETLPNTPERAGQELEVQMSLFTPFLVLKGFAAPELGHACDRAWELCQNLGETPQIFTALWHLGSFYALRGNYVTSLEIGDQMLSLALDAEDPVLIALARWGLGFNLVRVGEFATGLVHLEHVISFYDPQVHQSLAFTYGSDPGVATRSWASWASWFLGHPDQAAKHSQEALALAQKLSHPAALAFAQGVASLFHLLRRDFQRTRELAESCLHLATEHKFPHWLAVMGFVSGLLQVEQGQTQEGISQMTQSLATYQAMGTEDIRSMMLALLAEGHGRAGQASEALETLAEALAFVKETGERFYEAEIHRLQGELLLVQGDTGRAEASFQRAIEVACQQSAKSWQLRAVMSLSRLWQTLGKQEQARHLLSETYGWFTEGFDTPDLREAEGLLEDWAMSGPPLG
jgi:DNA-binding SARP family transcriptional activator/predicted ATPase